jgi:hypothetical protein
MWYQNGWSTLSHNSMAFIRLTAIITLMSILGTRNFRTICLRLLYCDIHHLFRGVTCHSDCTVTYCRVLRFSKAIANTLHSRFQATGKCLVKTLVTSMPHSKKSAGDNQCLLWQLGKWHTHSTAVDVFKVNKPLVGEDHNWQKRVAELVALMTKDTKLILHFMFSLPKTGVTSGKLCSHIAFGRDHTKEHKIV